MNLAEIIEWSRIRYRHRPAVITDGETIDYQNLSRMVNNLACYLKEQGYDNSSRIGIILPNSLEFIVSYLAILKIGAVVVPICTLYKQYELGYIFSNAELSLVITVDRYTGEIAKGAQITDFDMPMLPLDNPQLGFDFRGIDKPLVPFFKKNKHDTAVLIYTAAHEGGYPRGVQLSHFNLMYDVQDTIHGYLGSANDVWCGVLPFYHTFGATCQVLDPIFAGGAISVINNFDTSLLVERIQRDKITIFTGVPTMFYQLMSLDDKKVEIFSRIKHSTSGGAPLSKELMGAFRQRFNTILREGYGISECSPVAAYNPLDGIMKDGSIGPPLRGVRAKIVDEDNRSLPPGKVGELCFKGPIVTTGYYKDAEFTKRHLVKGWLHTGDLGYMDDDNYIYLTGLKKRMYLVGGFNVYPEELERLFSYHPDIEKARIRAEPDQVFGSSLIVDVYPKAGCDLTPSDVRSFCLRNMAIYKIPRKINIITEDL